MKRYYVTMIITTVLLMFALILWLDDIAKAWIITVIIVLLERIGYKILLSRKSLAILNEDCDPMKYLEVLEKLMKTSKTNIKINLVYGINQSAGLMSAGEFIKAKEVLLMFEDAYRMSKNKIFAFIFHNNLMMCLYQLGEISEAEKLYDSVFATYSTNNKKIKQALEMIQTERLFHLGYFVESKERFHQQLSWKQNKRGRLDAIYRLAQIAEKSGDIEQAVVHYSEVAEKGNQLWIAKQAKEKVSMLEVAV